MMLQTNFRLLRRAGMRESRYKHLARTLGGIRKYGRGTPITLLQILDICGLDDALWALRACPGSERFTRLLACDYFEHINMPIYESLHPNDKRYRNAIETARCYANGQATDNELAEAQNYTIVAHSDVWTAAWFTCPDVRELDHQFVDCQWQEQHLRKMLNDE